MSRPMRPARFLLGRAFFAFTGWVCLAVAPGQVWAAPPQDASPEPGLTEKEIYERGLIERSLEILGLEPVPAPGGRTIARIEVVRLPIIEASDPWPDFVNLFHVVTREHIVRQELLFDAGQAYDEEQVRESARNLRSLPLLFSTVRIVAAQDPDSGELVVLVITKDLWSIRLNSNGNFGGGQFNYFYVTPSEQNFLGLNQRASLHYYIDRDVQAFGQLYSVPRLFGSRVSLFESAAVRVNHHTGDVEGGYANLLIQRPLFALQATWGFWASASVDLGIDRFYQGDGIRRWEVSVDETVYTLPEIYSHERWSVSAGIQRSFGTRYKTDLTFGYQLRSRIYELTDGFSLLPARVRRAYEGTVVPVNDRAGAVTAGVRFYEGRYTRMHNVQTLGLTEDFRLGLSISADVLLAHPAFGFNQESVRLDLSLSYRLKLGDDLLALSASAGARFQPEHGLEDVSTAWVDQGYEVQAENVSPSLWGLGRLLVRVRYAYSQNSRTRFRYSLGGDNTLRGFVSGFTFGERLLNFNVEFRTTPWVIYTMHLGLVAFYDGGDAYGFSADDDFAYHQAVGIGIRGLFPQFDRGALRVDLGMPLGRDFHTRAVEWVSIAYQQAF